jgi:hypothetical protein
MALHWRFWTCVRRERTRSVALRKISVTHCHSKMISSLGGPTVVKRRTETLCRSGRRAVTTLSLRQRWLCQNSQNPVLLDDLPYNRECVKFLLLLPFVTSLPLVELTRRLRKFYRCRIRTCIKWNGRTWLRFFWSTESSECTWSLDTWLLRIEQVLTETYGRTYYLRAPTGQDADKVKILDGQLL